jgi:sterol carrier protein 2
VWHLRGWATNRAKPHTRHCLQHNLGLGGAVVITMYRRPDRSEAPTPENSKQSQGKVEDGRKWAGYNPAVEARWITDADLERVKSRVKGSIKMVEGRRAFKGEARL